MWPEQAIIEWSRRVISIVACCRGAKLCAHAAQDFQLQQNGAVTRMWRSCQGQPSHKERAIGVVRCEKEGMLLQLLRWCCVDCVIHHERDVREEQKYMYVARTSNSAIGFANWRYKRSRYKRIQMYRTDSQQVSGPIRIKLKS